MGKIFCIMGKSSSGKDAVYKRIMKRGHTGLLEITPYTTRPIRDDEEDGKAYHFCDEAKMAKLESEGKIIERRDYNTIHGVWSYFTVDDGSIDIAHNSYIMIGTLEAYTKLRDYFGNDAVVPIYIEIDDGTRLERAFNREKKQQEPKYEELCRRFLADQVDFSEDNLKAAGITNRFVNEDLLITIEDILKFIKTIQQ